MAKKENSNFSKVIRGLKEVVVITFTNKSIQTEFQPEKPEKNKQTEENIDDKVPLQKISGDNELILDKEVLQEMLHFFDNHSLLDTYTASCYFNNDECEINMYAFPRIVHSQNDMPFIKDVVTIAIYRDNSPVAMAEYNTIDLKAKDKFKSDTEMLMPKYYNDKENDKENAKENGKKMSLKDSLAIRFPGLTIPENLPVFEGSEYSGKEQPHDI